MKAAPGQVVSIYYDAVDGVEVVVGDALVTRTGRTYVIVSLRQQPRGKHAGRFHLRAVVAEGRAPHGVRVHHLFWYPRGPSGRL